MAGAIKTKHAFLMPFPTFTLFVNNANQKSSLIFSLIWLVVWLAYSFKCLKKSVERWYLQKQSKIHVLIIILIRRQREVQIFTLNMASTGSVHAMRLCVHLHLHFKVFTHNFFPFWTLIETYQSV